MARRGGAVRLQRGQDVLARRAAPGRRQVGDVAGDGFDLGFSRREQDLDLERQLELGDVAAGALAGRPQSRRAFRAGASGLAGVLFQPSAWRTIASSQRGVARFAEPDRRPRPLDRAGAAARGLG